MLMTVPLYLPLHHLVRSYETSPIIFLLFTAEEMGAE